MQILATVRPEAFDASGALFVPLAPSHSGSDPVYTATTLGQVACYSHQTALPNHYAHMHSLTSRKNDAKILRLSRTRRRPSSQLTPLCTRKGTRGEPLETEEPFWRKIGAATTMPRLHTKAVGSPDSRTTAAFWPPGASYRGNLSTNPQ